MLGANVFSKPQERWKVIFHYGLRDGLIIQTGFLRRILEKLLNLRFVSDASRQERPIPKYEVPLEAAGFSGVVLAPKNILAALFL